MTTIYREDVTCSVCGHQSETMVIGSTNEFGSSDLDFRPPEMMRSTIPYWLHECPSCGCSADDLADVDPRVPNVVRNPAFRSMRSGLGELSDSARKFRTATFIACELGDYAGAFLRALHEAWVHDDEGDSIRARAVRLDAVDFLHQVHRGGLRVYPEMGADEMVTVDIFRRPASSIAPPGSARRSCRSPARTRSARCSSFSGSCATAGTRAATPWTKSSAGAEWEAGPIVIKVDTHSGNETGRSRLEARVPGVYRATGVANNSSG